MSRPLTFISMQIWTNYETHIFKKWGYVHPARLCQWIGPPVRLRWHHHQFSSVAWVIYAHGGLQFCRLQKSWGAWCRRYHPHFCHCHPHFAAPSWLPPLLCHCISFYRKYIFDTIFTWHCAVGCTFRFRAAIAKGRYSHCIMENPNPNHNPLYSGYSGPWL